MGCRRKSIDFFTDFKFLKISRGDGSANVLVGRGVGGCRGGHPRSGAGPRPILSALAQAGFDGVLMDVEHDIFEMPVVADVSIPIVPHPEVICVRDAKFYLFVVGQCPAGGDGFPTLDNPGDGRESFHENMHMVRHDAPRDESITLAVEVLQCVAHLLRQFRVAQGAAAHAGIEPLFDFLASVSGALIFGKLQQLLFEKREFFLWEAVGEAEGDGLEEFFCVAVGEIASGIPLLWGFAGSANVPVGFGGGSVFHGCLWADGDVGAPIFPNS